jgi:CubicO group peptidase (beta-lactamase class C family)
MLLNGGVYNGVRVVSDSAVALFTKRAAGHRALGWDTCDGGAGCGQYMSERAFGHTGFTGTSLWIDPDRQMFVILLTNRVHAARARRPSTVIADVRNDLADAAVLAVMDDPSGVMAMPVSFRADRAQDWNRPLRSSRSRSAAARRRGATQRAAAQRAATRRAAAKKSTAKTSKAKSPSAKASAAKTKAVAKKTSVVKTKSAAKTKSTAKKTSVAPKKSTVKKRAKTPR